MRTSSDSACASNPGFRGATLVPAHSCSPSREYWLRSASAVLAPGAPKNSTLRTLPQPARKVLSWSSKESHLLPLSLEGIGTLDAFIEYFGPGEEMARFCAVSFAVGGHGGGEFSDAIWSGDRTSNFRIRIETPCPESAMEAFPAQGSWRQRASLNIEMTCSPGWLLPGTPKVTVIDLGGDWNATYRNLIAAALAQAGVDYQLTGS